MRNGLRLLALALVALHVCAMTCTASAEDSLERAKKDGITYGFSSEPPYAFIGPDGKPAGISSEMIISVFKRMGIDNVRPVLTEWASLIPGLKARRFDVTVIMFILPARCREVAFSEPFLRNESAMLVNKSNPKNIHSYEDVAKNSKAIVAVMSGAAEHNYARRAGVPDERILALQDPAAMLSAVKAGRADAAALTPGSVQSMADKGGGDVEAAKPFVTADYAVAYSAPAFRKEDVSLLDAFNKAAKQFIGSEEYVAINKKIGRGPEVIPGDKKTEDSCK